MHARDEVRAVQALIDEYHLLAADVTERHGAAFLRNDDAPTRYDGNHVRRIRAADRTELEALLAEADRCFAHLPYRSIRTDPLTPPFVDARLLLDDYAYSTEIVMAADGPLAGRAATVEVVPVDDDAGWAALRGLMAMDAGEVQADGVYALARRRGGAFRWYLAMVDGRAVGHFSQRTRDGLGYLESLFVDPAYRRRGIATALTHHAAREAHAAGARRVFLPAAADDTPKQMYARMGFRPLYVFRNYHKDVPSEA